MVGKRRDQSGGPALAGIVNSAGGFATSSEVELTTMYSNAANTADFHDITTDYCGPFAGFTAKQDGGK